MLIEITYNVTDVYMSTTETPIYVEISFEQPGGSSAVWGAITGTLSNQTDLQNALNAKLDLSTIDGGTEGQILSKASGTDFDFAWINNYAKYLATNVRNQSGSTIGAFQVVYISGATGNKPLISLADADTEATSSKTYGVTATSIANNSTGDVVTAGELTGIDTSAFNEGDLLWLSTTAGGVVTTPPAEPAHAVFIGYVVRSHPTLGTIDVSIQNGYELNELHGVQITSAANNDGLFYNSTSTLWENKSIATALGFTPVPTTRTITINGVTYDLSADRTWTIAAGISGSGAAGQVTYWTGASAVSGSNNLFWDNANGRLGIGTNAPVDTLHLNSGGIRIQNIRASLDNFYTAGVVNGLKIQNTTTNGRTLLGLVPNGTSTLADFWVFQTSDTTTNYSALAWGFEATSNYWGINSISAGTGVTRPIYINATNAQNVGTANISFYTNGNVGVGTGSTAPSVRFGVTGDTLLRGSGATSATTALTVQNSSSTNLLTVRNDGLTTMNFATINENLTVLKNLSSTEIVRFARNANRRLIYNTDGFLSMFSDTGANSGAADWFNAWIFGNFRMDTPVSTTQSFLALTGSIIPTSGNAQFNGILIYPTINQTGGANGITRGLYVNPTLTAAADFRAIETSAGNVLFGSNFFWDNTNSRLGIGTNAPSTTLDIRGKARIETTGTTELDMFGGGGNILRISCSSTTPFIGTLTNAPLGFFTSATERGRFTTNGNLMLGTTSDLGVRLGVVGDTILRGSGATSATTALTVQNSSSTNLFTVRNDGFVNITNTLASSLSVNSSNFTTRILINNTNATPNAGFELQTNGVTNWALANYKPTATTNASFVFYNQRTSTDSFFIDGDTNNVGIRTNAPTARLDIPASVTTAASLRIRSGTAPTSPNDGDIWFDGTDIKMRIGGVTKTFTLI